jgi:hypothetical protein
MRFRRGPVEMMMMMMAGEMMRMGGMQIDA